MNTDRITQESTVSETKSSPQAEEYNETFFAEAIKEITELYNNKGEKLVSTILAQSKAELVEEKLTLYVPNGFNNESLMEQKYALKQFFSQKLPAIEFDLDFVEIKVDFKPDIPYSYEDRVQSIVEENPDIMEWINKLDLKSGG